MHEGLGIFALIPLDRLLRQDELVQPLQLSNKLGKRCRICIIDMNVCVCVRARVLAYMCV